MDLLRVAAHVGLAASLGGCVSASVTDFKSVGTATDPSGTRPLAMQVSLVQCDEPSLQIGASCRVPVRLDSGGHSFYRSFNDRGEPVACVLDGRAVTIKGVWGKEQYGGFLDAELSTINDKGQLSVVTLHGTEVEMRELTPACLPPGRDLPDAPATNEP